MTTRADVVNISNVKAELLIRSRLVVRSYAFADIVVWRVAPGVRGSSHGYKYRLAYIVEDVCVLRYDNEAGKGDHRHWGSRQVSYAFVDMDKLLDDFNKDIVRWNRENRRS